MKQNNLFHSPHSSAERIQSLVRAFFDGFSTPEQEREIYAYFRTHRPGSVPASLEQYRAMFSWYENLERAPQEKTTGRRTMRTVVAIAASLTLLIAAGTVYFTTMSRHENFPTPNPMTHGYASSDTASEVINDINDTTLIESAIRDVENQGEKEFIMNSFFE